MAARRRVMDVGRIRAAVNGRLDELGLRNVELQQRMAVVRSAGTSSKTVDLLTNDRPKQFFEADILRAASVALEWQPDALQQVEAGSDWRTLPRRPWLDGPPVEAGLESRLEWLERAVEAEHEERAALRAEVAALRSLVEQALQQRAGDTPPDPA